MPACLIDDERSSVRAPLCEPLCPQRLSGDVNDVDCKECVDLRIGVLIEDLRESIIELQKCRDRLEELDAKRLKGGE